MPILPNNKILAAPLAGVSDTVYCRWALRYGAGLVFTGMVCAEGIRRRSKKTVELLKFPEDVRPIGAQLFDNDPDAIREAAPFVEQMGFDLIDINLGCPAKKVIRKGAGACLMKSPSKAAGIVRAAVESVSIPVSAKIRTGWDSSDTFQELIYRLADVGVAFVTLHPRSRKQGFSGIADLDKIAEAVELSPFPVVGNGDIRSGEDARRMISKTGCAAVMVGRGSFGNPWIFEEISAALEGRPIPPPPDRKARLDGCAEFIRDLVEFYGEKKAGEIGRKHVGWFTKGMSDGKRVRILAFGCETASEIIRVLEKER